MDEAVKELIATIGAMAEDARVTYASTKGFRANDANTTTCVTQQVPVALLNRIRELHDATAGDTACAIRQQRRR